MQEPNLQQEAFINEMAGYAGYLHKQGWTSEQIKAALITRGLDETNAACIVDGFERAKKERLDNAGTIVKTILGLLGLAAGK
ncbi:hypothetical protein [Mucilaginibacter pedocola]|uniref:Uncharacterized protein n=1 Tax=Mucilaginibacter pedocola TaxID=1792845 RepID=A0A1S9PEQ0_9SPHI|nr:hypothetical protein [Mucilaginibacter pedocola]OOQ59425.1 hypothetical protein BC343_04380 [Mucilaginibacter pedocola]